MKSINFIVKVTLSCLLPGFLFAQDYTISGSIRDATSGESLIGATVHIASHDVGTTTNAYGFYSLTAPSKDSISVLFSYLGYEAQLKKIYCLHLAQRAIYHCRSWFFV